MKTVSVSELKAKLARYLRLVKGGEELQIEERGVPVARVSALAKEGPLEIIPPRKDPRLLAKMRFSAKLPGVPDVVKLLLEDRAKR